VATTKTLFASVTSTVTETPATFSNDEEEVDALPLDEALGKSLL